MYLVPVCVYSVSYYLNIATGHFARYEMDVKTSFTSQVITLQSLRSDALSHLPPPSNGDFYHIEMRIFTQRKNIISVQINTIHLIFPHKKTF